MARNMITYFIALSVGTWNEWSKWKLLRSHERFGKWVYWSTSYLGENMIFKLILQIDIMSISWEIALMWMPDNSFMTNQH